MDGTTVITKSGSITSIADGTLLPSGSILQVVTTVDNTKYGLQVGQTPYNYSDLNTAITLKKANSKND